MNKNLILILILIIIILIFSLEKKDTSHQFKTKLFSLSDNMKINKVDKDIYVIDNFYKNPDDVRNYAIGKKFKLHSTLYETQFYNPKLFYNISKQLITFFENISNTKINENEWNKDLLNDSNGFFQYITKKSNPVIHNDFYWGVIIYLTPNPQSPSGTSLFQHKETNIYKVNDSTYQVNKDLWKEGEKSKINKWKIRHRIENKYNRALIFDSRNFHSSDGGFGDNIKNSRLYQTFFFSNFLRKNNN